MHRLPIRTRAIRIAGLAYAALAFIATFAFFSYFVVFLGNLPKPSNPWISPTVDVGGTVEPLWLAALIDIGLVALFGLQHSVMARPGFKAWWTRVVPKGLERATYTMAASLVGFVMMVFWQPIPLTIWQVSGPFAVPFWLLFAIGWTILLSAGITFNLFELLGLRQAWAWYRGRPIPPLTLKTHWLYDWMRHPMYVGVLLGLWMTPHMTVGHALMAATFTLYILIAMRYEERDLSANFGAAYAAWRAGADRGRLLPGRDGTGAR
jgi:protein-S-isoprenylcysteine O-methyltransferase Ste14